VFILRNKPYSLDPPPHHALPLTSYSGGTTRSSLGSLSCSASSCYSSTGVSTTCMPYYPFTTSPASVSTSQAPVQATFAIFNASQWAVPLPTGGASALSALLAAQSTAAATTAKYGSCRQIAGTTFTSPAELYTPAVCGGGFPIADFASATTSSSSSSSSTSSSSSNPPWASEARAQGCVTNYCQCLVSCAALCAQTERREALQGSAIVAR